MSRIGQASPADIPDSASEADALNELSLSADQIAGYPHVVDLVYSDSQTPLVAAARRHGAHTVEGAQMLVAQGALSFKLWTGVDPPLEVMHAAARREGGRS